MSRKVLGWNINQRSGLGKEIPELVFQELLVNILASGNRNSGAVETYIPDTETAFDWLNYHP